MANRLIFTAFRFIFHDHKQLFCLTPSSPLPSLLPTVHFFLACITWVPLTLQFSLKSVVLVSPIPPTSLPLRIHTRALFFSNTSLLSYAYYSSPFKLHFPFTSKSSLVSYPLRQHTSGLPYTLPILSPNTTLHFLHVRITLLLTNSTSPTLPYLPLYDTRFNSTLHHFTMPRFYSSNTTLPFSHMRIIV